MATYLTALLSKKQLKRKLRESVRLARTAAYVEVARHESGKVVKSFTRRDQHAVCSFHGLAVNSPKTTALYTHLTAPVCALLDSPIQQLVQDICP